MTPSVQFKGHCIITACHTTLVFPGIIDSMASQNSPETHRTQPAKTSLFKQQKDGTTFRIPALIFISDAHTFLAFAEERSTPRDSDAKLLVMRRGSLHNGSIQVMHFLSR